ncbi:MAG: AAA family ATPase [Myxococcales bacterium]|nr:AAA family ATPase [Myxococcales bacterium]
MDAPAPYTTVLAAELASSTPPLAWLADGLFLVGGAGILGGAPKSGKSFFALDLAVAVASATPCAGRFTIPTKGRVMLLCAEDPHAVVVERLKALARSRGLELADLPLDVIVEPVVRLPEGLPRLRATLDKTRPSLLLLDPLIRLHRADENSAAEMSLILDGLRSLARASMTAILLVHHTRKAPAGPSAGAALRGSSDLHAFGDTNLYFRKLATDGTVELRIEHRATACPQPIQLRLAVDETAATARFLPLDKDGSVADPLANRLLAALAKADAPMSSRTLRATLGVRNQLIGDTLRRLVDQGRVLHARDGFALVRSASGSGSL